MSNNHPNRTHNNDDRSEDSRKLWPFFFIIPILGFSFLPITGGNTLQMESGNLTCVIPKNIQDGTCQYNFPVAFKTPPSFFIVDSHPPTGNRTEPIFFPNTNGTFQIASAIFELANQTQMMFSPQALDSIGLAVHFESDSLGNCPSSGSFIKSQWSPWAVNTGNLTWFDLTNNVLVDCSVGFSTNGNGGFGPPNGVPCSVDIGVAFNDCWNNSTFRKVPADPSWNKNANLITNRPGGIVPILIRVVGGGGSAVNPIRIFAISLILVIRVTALITIQIITATSIALNWAFSGPLSHATQSWVADWVAIDPGCTTTGTAPGVTAITGCLTQT